MLTAIALGLCPAAQAQTDTGGFSTGIGAPADAIPINVSTLDELTRAVTNNAHRIVINGHIYGGPKLKTLTFSDNSWDNTTIEGASGGNAVLENIQLKFSGEKLSDGRNISNIIIRDITFSGRISDLQALPPQVKGTSDDAGINYLGVSLRRVSNAWIDHCTFYDISDDLFSIGLSSDKITVSYNHFYFSDNWLTMQPDPVWNWVGTYNDLAGERLAMLVGINKDDSYAYGGNALHVTIHHNWIGPNMRGRPLLRGWVHAYNNYFDNSTAPDGYNKGTDGKSYPTVQYNALQIGSGSNVVSESNYFYKTKNSNQIGLDADGDNYSFRERNNVYESTTGKSATGTSFTGSPVKYTYKLDSASSLSSLQKGSTGPR
ncbi:hypothetical protein [Methylobacterium sp. J-077]|uniref:pectate lyase family protein n=1 Tax=Methylobacterium sp. J-077 TaxID=2836656 RepID=UPI001FBB87B9|nr:hypothetical protein [Methylobacterium sp. J-077]MCJ2122506.1 hypothetical protein [Methylobacterium sp. J-077]